MIDAKVLRVSRMKVERCWNAPNLYTLLEIDGGALQTAPAKNCREKRVQNLKPTTPRAVRVENHPPAMRKLHGLVGKLLGRLRKQEDRKQWRLEKAQRRNEMALRACVGMNTYRGATVSDAEAEEIRQRIRAKELECRAKYRALVGV